MGQLQSALCYGSGGGGSFAFAGDRHGREGEFDAVFVERLLDHRIGLAPDDELLAGQGHHLHPDLNREIAKVLNTLHLQRLEDQRRELFVLLQIQPDLLDQLAGALEIAVVGDADHQLVDDPVTALVLDCTQEAERHGVDRATVVSQLDRANAEAFDRTLVIAALDVLADPEGVIHQIEHAGDDVADKGLRAKADRNPDDAQTGDQRADLDAHRRQRHQRGDSDDDDEQNIAKNRQQCPQPRLPARLVGVRQAKDDALGEVAIDRRFDRMPQKVGDEQYDDSAQHAMGDPGKRGVLPGEVHDVDTPAPAEHGDRTDDHQRPDAALEDDREDVGGTLSRLARAGRPQQMLDRAAGDGDGKRQGDDHQNEPETRHGVSYPEHPQQNDTGGHHRVAGAAAETMRRGGGRLLFVRHCGTAPDRFQRDGEEA